MSYKLEGKDKVSGRQYYRFKVRDETAKGGVSRISKEEFIKRFGKLCFEADELGPDHYDSILSMEFDSKKERARKRLGWKNKYKNIKDLYLWFENKQKINAPNSWKNNRNYLQNYVFHYFLNIKELNNPFAWFNYFENFRDWLRTDARLVTNKNKQPSIASRNHAIKALNVFMRHLKKEHPKQELPLCEYFEEDINSFKTVEDLILEDEQVKVEEALRVLDFHSEADFFNMVYLTGMRFNESLGISLKDLYANDIPDVHFKKKLRKQNIYYFKDENIPKNSQDIEFMYYGYLVLGSQPSGDGKKAINRNLESGTIPRKPLKSQKEMYGKHLGTRLIPIIDKELMKTLMTRASLAQKLLNDKIHPTRDKGDYLLFPRIIRATSTKRYIQAFEHCKLKYRNWHCCRHTRGTFLFRSTDREMAKIWLGHTSDKVFERYNHAISQLMLNIQKKVSSFNKNDVEDYFK